MTIDVYVEEGERRVFAGALGWPGWCRSGRDEGSALAALLPHAPRYAEVVAGGSLGFRTPTRSVSLSLRVVERLAGDATTDFGAPSAVPAADRAPLDAIVAQRIVGVHSACWDRFLAGVERAGKTPLAKGPRGGGRDAPKIVSHVVEAEGMYLSKLGTRVKSAGPNVLRAAFERAIEEMASGRPVSSPSRVREPWPARYAVRRSAWHLLDHLWEIEDRLG